jgi:sulfide:quinone oxidoreductase
MSRKKVLVLGGNFGGLTAALALNHELHSDVDITVVSASDRFVFNPSMIWLPFGKRTPDDITFPLAPTFEANNIAFVHAAATKIDPKAQVVETVSGKYPYDYLVIATGYKNNFDVAPGLGPDGNAHTITTLPDAIRAGEGWKRFLQNPGDVVIGASQGASCFGAAYEYLFNAAHQLKKAGLHKQVKLTYVTSEPYVGHFGIDGMSNGKSLLNLFLKSKNIAAITNASIEHVDTDEMVLVGGQKLPFKYSMIIPPFLGQDVVRDTTDLADAKGYVNVHDTYQSKTHDNVYAVGIAAAVPIPWTTPTPTGIPKTGFPTERMAHIAAKNIAAQIRGESPNESEAFGRIPAVCVLDAGNNGVIMLADHLLPPRKLALLIPGPQAHLMKLGFEKYFIWKAKNGHVRLP